MGGLPGEKNRSLIRGAARNIAANNAGVENGAGFRADAAAATAGPGVVLEEDDMRASDNES
jgi:hypothetical protein